MTDQDFNDDAFEEEPSEELEEKLEEESLEEPSEEPSEEAGNDTDKAHSMSTMEVRVKRLHEDAQLPERAYPTDAGFDLVATSVEEDKERGIVKYGTGIALEIPRGYAGFIFPRSSVYKHCLTLSNSVGVVDSGYRGEVMVMFDLDAEQKSSKNPIYVVGDRIAQLVIMRCPEIAFACADELGEADRAGNGFGSTGN